MNTKRHFCTVIPDHITRHIAETGDAEARITARATLLETRTLAQKRQRTLIEVSSNGTGGGGGKVRNIYDAQHRRTLPGKLVLSESGGKKSSDVEVNQAFDNSGVVIDFLKRRFNRLSIDGKGMPVISTVHYGTRFNNAMWNGEQMVYGDGDGKLFNPFTKPVDVQGHELMHGVTQYTAGLDYTGQSGALNEHISDAIGIMIKQELLGLTARQSNWLIGEGLLAKGVKGKAIRSMKAPGTAYDDPRLGRDPQPAHMRNYVQTDDDDGGVHINSGIPNHAFYIAAVTIGGYTWEVLGQVWYETLTNWLRPSATFQDFANATVKVAGARYGLDVQGAVAAAWGVVGLPVRSTASAHGVPRPSERWRRRPATAASTTKRVKKGDSK